MAGFNYIPNGGQTYIPFRENVHVPQPEFTPLGRPQPPLPDFQLTHEAQDKGWVVASPCQHFLPGVEPEMLDWWWANMEKGYYLWAPAAHKRFNWVRSPGEAGFLASSHMISEAMVPGGPVFGGDGVQIFRLGLEYYPFTASLGHVIVEGTFNQKEELCDMTIHMWDGAPGGTVHYTCAIVNTRCTMPPDFVLADPGSAPSDEARAVHAEYEASRWPVFLPTLYRLWAGHPDPSQNVTCDLSVRWQDGKVTYIHENGPVKI